MIFGNHSKNAVQKSDISTLPAIGKLSLTKRLPNYQFLKFNT